MPVGGTGSIIYLSDAEENAARISTAGRAYLAESYSRIKTHSPINVTSLSGGTGFETVAVGRVILRSESGNSIMWIGGTGDDSPYSGKGYPLFGGEQTEPLPVTNFNAIRVCAAVSGQLVYAIGFLNGEDIILTNQAPVPPYTPPPPEAISPIVVEHSPVSGYSGLAFNSQISVTFNEAILSGSVTSGSFHLSPAHNVTIFRDLADETKIIMSPNVNLSGETTYYVGVNYQITDLVGNRVSGTSGNSWAFTWPFTTGAAPPPPDVTAPVVSGTSPASGATNVSPSTDVTITFSEPMTSATINPLNIYLSYLSGVVPTSGISGTVSLAVDEKTVTINPTPTRLSGGSLVHINILSGVTDVADTPNAMAAHDRSRTFTTAIYDSTPPTISGVVPLSGATNIGTDTNVIVTFSEQMLSGTITASNLYLSYTSGAVVTSGISGVVALSGNGIAAEINPTSDLSGSTLIHVNILTAVQDLAGNALTAADRSRVFSTEVLDTTRPTVTSVYPTNGATNVDTGVWPRVVFSESMLSGTINSSNIFLSITSGGSANPSAYDYVRLSGGTSAEINPTGALTGGITYYINVLEGVQDLAGNTMLNANRGNSFTTIYNFQQAYYITGNQVGDLYSGDDVRYGSQAAEPTCSLLGLTFKKIVFYLRKVGSPTGTGYCRIRNSSNTIMATMGSINVATALSTGFQSIAFTNISNTYQLQEDDRILFEYGGGNSSNRVEIERLDANGFAGTRLTKYAGSWTDDGGQEVAGEFYY